MECSDMIAGLHGNVILAVSGDGVQHLAVEQDIHPALDRRDQGAALIDGVAYRQKGTEYHDDGKCADVLKGRLQVFEFFEHTIGICRNCLSAFPNYNYWFV